MKKDYIKMTKIADKLNDFEGYRLEIYEKNKTYAFIKDREEVDLSNNARTYAVGFQVSNKNE